jgi:hypothetical protein
MTDEPNNRHILEIPADHILVQNALNLASIDGGLMQKRVGYHILIINDSKAAWIPTDEIEV